MIETGIKRKGSDLIRSIEMALGLYVTGEYLTNFSELMSTVQELFGNTS